MWTMKMPFGKHKGKDVSKLPPEYCYGLLKHVHIKDDKLKKMLETNRDSFFDNQEKYKCITCGKFITPDNGILKCCGFNETIEYVKEANEKYKANIRQSRRNILSCLGNGFIQTTYGIITYVDDGNGNTWDIDSQDEDDWNSY